METRLRERDRGIACKFYAKSIGKATSVRLFSFENNPCSGIRRMTESGRPAGHCDGESAIAL